MAGVHHRRSPAGLGPQRAGALLPQRSNDFVAAEVRTAPALGFFQSYAVTPGDRRFLMVREGAPSQQSELIMTENWFQELKAQTRQ